MRIIECYIENFGKISKKKYDFKNGLNCINSDNGSGKTTLAAFIKVMFYGMSDTKKLSLEENDRKHYLPWGGGLCGGSLTFSVGSKVYRVERSFAPKAADDTYALYDTSTGRVANDFPEGLGEGLFGIDADGFERTVFLSERALTPKSDNKSISAKLSDLVGCDGDIGGLDEAMKILENQRKFYYKKGGSGELADIKSRIDDITRRLNSLDEVEVAIEATHGKMIELSNKIASARAEGKEFLRERETLTIRAAEVNFERRYAEMKAELEAAITRRTQVSELFGLNIPTFVDIDEARYKATEAKNLLASSYETPETREFNRLSLKFDGKIEKGQIENARMAISSLESKRIDENSPDVKRARRIFVNRIPTEEEISFARKLQETMILTKAQKEQAPFAEKVLDPAPPVAHGGSTDTADVSWNCPTVQMHIGTWCVGTPTHSWQSATQAKGPYAHRAMLYASKAVAQTIMRLFDDPKLLEQAKREHSEKVGEEGYICPIPKDLKPIILPRP